MRAPLLLVMFAACGESPSTTIDAAIAIDASGVPTTCTDTCRTTALTATFAATRVLDRAHYGVTTSAGGATLHVEVHRGGGTGCPTSSSPAPDYTLVLGRVPLP